MRNPRTSVCLPEHTCIDTMVTEWASLFEGKTPRECLRIQLAISEKIKGLALDDCRLDQWVNAWSQAYLRNGPRFYYAALQINHAVLGFTQIDDIEVCIARGHRYFDRSPMASVLWQHLLDDWLQQEDTMYARIGQLAGPGNVRVYQRPEHPVWTGLFLAMAQTHTQLLHQTLDNPELAAQISSYGWRLLGEQHLDTNGLLAAQACCEHPWEYWTMRQTNQVAAALPANVTTFS